VSSSKGLAACALVTVLAAPVAAQTRYFSRGDLQSAIAELDATDLQGRRWNASTLAGRVVLIEFWASWCAPCLAEIPLLRTLRAAHGPERFEVLAVSLNSSDRRSLIAWVNRQGLDWPQIHEGRAFNGPTARMFGVRALPASILLDERGRVAAVNLRGTALKRAIDALVYRTSTSSLDAARIPIVRR
jgi:thiol-disulfide isomerase/thioredoxin